MSQVAGTSVNQCPSRYMYNHQHLAYHRLSRFASFSGRRILEVGGNQRAESALPFIQAGAAEVVVTGLLHVNAERLDSDNGIRVMRADAYALEQISGPCSFDFVYGLSVIEHLPRLTRFLEQVHQVLKPGGLAFFEGDPIWTSARGHHLWVQTDTAKYTFALPAGVESINPVPDWAHLLLDADEMSAVLRERKPEIPDSDIEAICNWIFSSDSISRLSHREIATAFSRCPLVTLHLASNWSQVPTEAAAELRRRIGDGNDFGISSLQYVLQKAA